MRRWLNRRRLFLGVAALFGLAVILVLEISTSPEHRSANAVAFSPDGSWIAALSTNWDSTTGRYSKAGRLRIWNTTRWDWNPATSQPFLSIPTSAACPLSLAFDSSGKSIVVGAWDGSVHRIESATGRPIQSYAGHSLPVRGLTFTPDGKTLVAGASDGVIILWDATTGKELRRFDRGTRSPVNSMSISADGRYIAASGGNRPDSTTLFNLETSEVMKLKTLDGTQEPVAFGPDASHLAVRVLGRPGSARIIDIEHDRIVATMAKSKAVRSLGFSLNGKELVTGGDDEMVNVWESETGDFLAQYDGHKSPSDPVAEYGRFAMAHLGQRSGRTVSPVWSVAYSPVGNAIASAGGDSVWIWDRPSRSTVSLSGAILPSATRSFWVRPAEIVLGIGALAFVVVAILSPTGSSAWPLQRWLSVVRRELSRSLTNPKIVGSNVRKFTISDAMILTASTAIGLAWFRVSMPDWESQLLDFQNRFSKAFDSLLSLVQWAWFWVLLSFPFVACWSVTLAILGLRRPRPDLQRLLRQPGFVASLVALMVIPGVFLSRCARMATRYSIAPNWEINGKDLFTYVMIESNSEMLAWTNHTVGIAIAVCWVLMVLGGRWRPQRNWLDRVGRLVGIYWIVVAMLAPFANLRQ